MFVGSFAKVYMQGVFPDLVQVIGGLTVVVDVKFEHEARIYGMGLIVCSVQDTVGAIFAR